MKRFALIMAGGSGTRFWPKSSARRPKQLLAFSGKKSQLQLTYDRLQGVVDKRDRWVVGTELLAAATRKQIKGVRVLAEPEGRNTMAAVCWGAWTAKGAKGAALSGRPGLLPTSRRVTGNEEALVVALPADAAIADEPAFRAVLNQAFEIADKEDRIVCLGIKPTYAATGYGYIQQGSSLAAGGGFEINRFLEKPDAETAADLFASGTYAWNAGIFVFKTSVFIDEVRKHAPEFAAFFDKNISSEKKVKAGYKKLPKVPIDTALMEKSSRGAVIPGDFGWNDVGSWRALEDVLPLNSEAGRVRAAAGHASIESGGNIVDVTDEKFVGLIGVKDLVIVETENALLVCHKEKAEQVKDLVGLISKNPKLKKRLL